MSTTSSRPGFRICLVTVQTPPAEQGRTRLHGLAMRVAPGFGTKPWRASEAPGRRSPAPRGGHGAGRAPETPPCGSAPRPPGGCGDQRGRTQPGQWKGGRRNYQGRVGCFKQNLIWCKKWNWDLARATMLPALSLEKRPFSQDRKSKALHFI